MKKLSLKIEDLRIETFVTDAAEGTRGTVQGAQASAAPTCFGQQTCVVCTRQQCYEPSEPGYGTFVNNICIRC
jgi:hypothetical protein